MEQALLVNLSDRLHSDNSEIITGLSEKELDAAWVAAVERQAVTRPNGMPG